MTFTSQICTTKEQSERLLALGLKKETADMAHQCIGVSPYKVWDKSEIGDNLFPAWSLHRLIDITGVHYLELWWHEGIYEQVISLIEERIGEGLINKEYLEE